VNTLQYTNNWLKKQATNKHFKRDKHALVTPKVLADILWPPG
jgi:hypothetical protein